VLHNFSGTDGAGPSGGVTLDPTGEIYGTTAGGGTGSACTGGCGTVFRLIRHPHGDWSEAVLYSFNANGNGSVPFGGLAFDAVGNVYGTATNGGNNYCSYGCSIVFELSPGSDSWAETVLYRFCTQSGCEDGGGAVAGLAMDAVGNLYGTAGVVYELTPGSDGWTEKVLHEFTKKHDGGAPYAGVILDAAGNLYGTTYGGGAYGDGTVYELTPQSGGHWKETILFRFNGKDGQWPGHGALFMDGSGALYGTTTNGGSYGGVVFKLTPKGNGRWRESTLYEFQGGASGWLPDAGVVMDKSGNLYGTTDGGGSGGCGGIYKLAPKPKGQWKYTVLHAFYGWDGCAPDGNRVLDKKGNLYGGTILGGTTGNGVVFELTP